MHRKNCSTARTTKQTIYKIIKRDPGYSQIPNEILRDTRTSWRAKGILAALLSFPDDWEIREGHIVKLSTDGIKSLKAGIKELMKMGHIERHKIRDAQGRFCGWETAVYEQPKNTEMPNTDVGFTDVGSTDVRESHSTNIDKTNKDERTNNTTTKESSYYDPHVKKEDRSIERYFPAVTGTDADKIVDVVVAIEYGSAGINNKKRLRRYLMKLLEDGRLEKPDGWECYRETEQLSLNRTQLVESVRQKEAAQELQARQDMEEFRKLPANEQEKYLVEASVKAGPIDVSAAILRIMAAQIAAGH
jgi:hypothetical protein